MTAIKLSNFWGKKTLLKFVDKNKTFYNIGFIILVVSLAQFNTFHNKHWGVSNNLPPIKPTLNTSHKNYVITYNNRPHNILFHSNIAIVWYS